MKIKLNTKDPINILKRLVSFGFFLFVLPIILLVFKDYLKSPLSLLFLLLLFILINYFTQKEHNNPLRSNVIASGYLISLFLPVIGTLLLFLEYKKENYWVITYSLILIIQGFVTLLYIFKSKNYELYIKSKNKIYPKHLNKS